MNLIFKIVMAAIYMIVAYYLLIPDIDFPLPTPDAVLSTEPADLESNLRRGYFTNYTREEVIQHYSKQFEFLPTLRLNYPPEDAQWIIRDQTRSYYLEELVHPLRTSIFINGFVPQEEKDAIVIDGVKYAQKVTIKYVPSNPVTRLAIFTISFIVGYFVINEWKKLILSPWTKTK